MHTWRYGSKLKSGLFVFHYLSNEVEIKLRKMEHLMLRTMGFQKISDCTWDQKRRLKEIFLLMDPWNTSRFLCDISKIVLDSLVLFQMGPQAPTGPSLTTRFGDVQ